MRFFLSFIAVLAVIIVCAFVPQDHKDNALAYVPVVDGYYKFVECTPVRSYDVLETEETSTTGRHKDVMRNCINRIKRFYPDADGVIIHLDGSKEYEIIKFK